MGNTLDRFWGVCGKFLSFYKTHDDGRRIVGQKRLQKAACFFFSMVRLKMRSSTLNVGKKTLATSDFFFYIRNEILTNKVDL